MPHFRVTLRARGALTDETRIVLNRYAFHAACTATRVFAALELDGSAPVKVEPLFDVPPAAPDDAVHEFPPDDTVAAARRALLHSAGELYGPNGYIVTVSLLGEGERSYPCSPRAPSGAASAAAEARRLWREDLDPRGRIRVRPYGLPYGNREPAEDFTALPPPSARPQPFRVEFWEIPETLPAPAPVLRRREVPGRSAELAAAETLRILARERPSAPPPARLYAEGLWSREQRFIDPDAALAAAEAFPHALVAEAA